MWGQFMGVLFLKDVGELGVFEGNRRGDIGSKL
jgi:hypothetical protein